MSASASAPLERHRPTSPAFQFALAAVVALLILSLWLHFFLALEIEGMGRDIDAQTEELERLQRANLAVMNQIALLDAQRRMASEATAMGYQLQSPLYLVVNRPLTGPASQAPKTPFLTIWDLSAGHGALLAEVRPVGLGRPGLSLVNLP